jgi:hypothetical protein
MTAPKFHAFNCQVAAELPKCKPKMKPKFHAFICRQSCMPSIAKVACLHLQPELHAFNRHMAKWHNCHGNQQREFAARSCDPPEYERSVIGSQPHCDEIWVEGLAVG